MDTDAMWRLIDAEGRRMEAHSDDMKVIVARRDVEGLRRKLTNLHATLGQLDQVFAKLDREPPIDR